MHARKAGAFVNIQPCARKSGFALEYAVGFESICKHTATGRQRLLGPPREARPVLDAA